MSARASFATAVAALLLGAATCAGAQPPNVALGHPVELDPWPNYPLCTDAGDKIQLTDGIETVDYFWTQKTTVGWQNKSSVSITVDLGRLTSIKGASLRSAAGTAGVSWPRSIQLLASDDGTDFHPLGDLVALSEREHGPPRSGYGIFRYRTEALQGRGRFVRFLLEPTGPVVFADEVEVYQGPEAWAQQPMRGTPVPDTERFLQSMQTHRGVVAALRRDLARASTRVEQSGASPQQRAGWQAEIERIEAQIAKLGPIAAEGFRAVLPIDPLQTAVFALIGRIDASSGEPALSAWRANPWDLLTPVDRKTSAPPPPGELSLLRGEVRPLAINLRNASAEAISVNASVSGLPQDALLEAYQVVWTENRHGSLLADALLSLPRTADGFEIDVPAGVTRQLWLRIGAGSLSAGGHSATLLLRASGLPAIEQPLPIRVVDVPFPQRPRLHVSGWDYTDAGPIYGVTQANLEPLVAYLRSRHVDSPWATPATLPFGSFDASGRLTSPPDTTRFDRWVARWPDASRYMIVVDSPERIGSIATGSQSFEPAVKAWLEFWAAHLTKLGRRPEQLQLLLFDEPQDAAAAAKLLPWARAIRKAGAGPRVWEDLPLPLPASMPREVLDLTDAVCVVRGGTVTPHASYWQDAAALRTPRRSVEIYTGGDARTLDPYAHFRLQAWQAFAIGGDGSSFWSFSDTGGNDPWNELNGTQVSHVPFFLTPDSVTPAKQMEAVAESAHDFEVLSLLRDAVEASPARGSPADLERARALLRDGPARVLGAAGADEHAWQAAKDRSQADLVRDEAALLLERLRQGALE